MLHSSDIIWCNNPFPENKQQVKKVLAEEAGTHQVFFFAPAENGLDGESRKILQAADIAFGSPDRETLMQSKKLRWVQLNSAGYTPYDHPDFWQHSKARGIALTNSSHVYDEPCAQHLLAMITSVARCLPQALDEQRGGRSWPMSRLRNNSRLLNEQTVLILGFGAIGRRLSKLLAPLGMQVTGVRRKVSGEEKIRVITEAGLDHYLPLTDHLVNTLPANESTKNFLNAKRFAQLKPETILYNIGRGTTIDQEALQRALEQNQLAAAYLDVTDPEPLPPEHPLWSTPNCYITPHTAGGHADETERQVRHFTDNLQRFINGEELVNRII